ncbi:amidohydrolase family protein [Robbsia sp. KACC 23696]|uniref:amidohydrolase family protein n=1 Tax=Robbsia sp. KACC 23696 TaxID=3149231 RepID=UPI00325A6CCE
MTTLIDSHVHVWKDDPAYPFAQGANVPAGIDASVEALLALMDAHRVQRTVLIQVIHYRWDNRYLADVLRRFPDRFHGVARVDPEDPAAPDHISAQAEQGFRGVRLSPAEGPQGDWIAGASMQPLWSRCESLKVPMTLLAPASRIPEIAKWIDRFPDVTVVIDHMADTPLDRPDLLAPLLSLQRYPNVFVKITHPWSLSRESYPYDDAFAQVERVYDVFGADRVMWGTDFPVSLPYASYGDVVALYRDGLRFMPPADREQVLYRTVQRVWPFGID